MKFLRTQFLNDTASCAAVRNVLMAGTELPDFMSYQLHGSETEPALVELFKSAKPAHDEHPIATLARVDGALVLELAAPKGKK